MTNPNNIVRVRARNGGRASVYEANAWCQAFGSGVLEGTGVVQNTSADMNVLVGGSATKPDVLIAENPAGYKIALDIIGQQAVALAAPASNSRISAIVAYTDDVALSTTQSDVTGSPSSCGLIVVNGTATANPVAPTDAQIREAITADGATGSQASYCVIATITVASNTTMITNNLISPKFTGISSRKIYLSSSTETITFKNENQIAVGDRAATLVKLDNNGLTMLLYQGNTGNIKNSAGRYTMFVEFSRPFSQVITSVMNGRCASDAGSHLAYSAIDTAGGDFYIVREKADGVLEFWVSMVVIGYMS